MKLYSPIRMVLTLHMGFQDSGWKSDMLRQRRLEHANRPFGVIIITDGGFIGYWRERGHAKIIQHGERGSASFIIVIEAVFTGYWGGGWPIPQYSKGGGQQHSTRRAGETSADPRNQWAKNGQQRPLGGGGGTDIQ